MKREGPRMTEVRLHVLHCPGCTRAEVAAALNMPRSSADAAIARAIRQGLIKVGGRRNRTGPETLYVTPFGRRDSAARA